MAGAIVNDALHAVGCRGVPWPDLDADTTHGAGLASELDAKPRFAAERGARRQRFLARSEGANGVAVRCLRDLRGRDRNRGRGQWRRSLGSMTDAGLVPVRVAGGNGRSSERRAGRPGQRRDGGPTPTPSSPA